MAQNEHRAIKTGFCTLCSSPIYDIVDWLDRRLGEVKECNCAEPLVEEFLPKKQPVVKLPKEQWSNQQMIADEIVNAIKIENEKSANNEDSETIVILKEILFELKK
jgi:hypothetical protein